MTGPTTTEQALRTEHAATHRFVQVVSLVLLVAAPFFTVEYWREGVRFLAATNAVGVAGAGIAFVLSLLPRWWNHARVGATASAALVATAIAVHGGPDGYEYLFLFTLPPSMTFLGGLRLGSAINVGFLGLLAASLVWPDTIRWARPNATMFNTRLVASYVALNVYVFLIVQQRRSAYNLFRRFSIRESQTDLRRASVIGIETPIGNRPAFLVSVPDSDWVHDRFGLDTAEAVHTAIADRLRTRFGDDSTYYYQPFEFLILGYRRDGIAADGTSYPELDTIRSAMSEPVRVGGVELVVRYRVTARSEPGDDRDTMLRHLRTARTIAQTAPPGETVWYHPSMTEALERRHTLGDAFERSIANGTELSLVFQPIVGRNGTVGWEALARWYSQEHGAVSPAEFVPIAEQRGLIPALTDWALETAWSTISTVPAGNHAPYVSVNLSAVYLSLPRPVERMQRMIARSGLNPQRVVLEITETALIEDLNRGSRVLDGLRALGFALAIDDFGTGYAGLRYLQSLRFDTLKIDRSYIDGIAASAKSRSIVEATCGIARAVGAGIVAEGVESIHDYDVLCGLGIDYFQGYLLARPDAALIQVEGPNRE